MQKYGMKDHGIRGKELATKERSFALRNDIPHFRFFTRYSFHLFIVQV